VTVTSDIDAAVVDARELGVAAPAVPGCEPPVARPSRSRITMSRVRMPGSPAEAQKPGIVLRLNPFMLRESAPYFGSESETVRLARLESDTVAVRKSFWECDAEYNPLGKFGASWSRA
jgi:hypothetical protein